MKCDAEHEGPTSRAAEAGNRSTVSYDLILSYILILLGLYLLVASGYDEFRGITTKPHTVIGESRRGTGHAYLYRIQVHREQNPQLFRRFMIGHWLWAVGIEGIGWILYLRNR